MRGPGRGEGCSYVKEDCSLKQLDARGFQDCLVSAQANVQIQFIDAQVVGCLKEKRGETTKNIRAMLFSLEALFESGTSSDTDGARGQISSQS